MNRTPRISIIIPVFNREKMIEEAVESALNQTYPNIEVVVVDDASTDRTCEKLQSYASDITLIRQTRNKGQSAARNRGIFAAEGSYLLFLDSDDALLNHAAETLWGALAPLNGVSSDGTISYGKRVVCDEALKPVKTKPKRYYSGHILSHMFTNHFIHTGTYLAPKAAIAEVGCFREDLAVKEDLLLYLLLAARYQFRFVDQPVIRYRRHGGNRARHNTDSIFEQGTRHLDYFFTTHPAVTRKRMEQKRYAYAAEYLLLGKYAWRSGAYDAYLTYWKAMCAARKEYFYHPKYLFRAMVSRIGKRL